eukprot:g4377.t1
MQSSNSMRNVAKVSPSVSKSTSKTSSELKMIQELDGEHSHFSTFDELYVPWENSVVSPPKTFAMRSTMAATVVPSPSPESPSLRTQSPTQGAVSPLSRDLPPSPMGAVAAIDDMAMVLQDTARAGLTKLMQERQKQSLSQRKLQESTRSPPASSPSIYFATPSTYTPASSGKATPITPHLNRVTATGIVENCIDDLMKGRSFSKNTKEMISGRVALTALAQLLKQEHSRTLILLETHEKAVASTKKRLMRLANMNSELDMFAAREVADTKLDEENAIRKVKQRKADLLVPMSQRGAARLGGMGLATETVGFLRGEDVVADGTDYEEDKIRKATASSGVKGLSDMSRRYAARKTRMHLIHVRIAALIQDQLRAQREAESTTVEDTKVGTKEYQELEEVVRSLREQLTLANAERQEAVSQLERERHDTEAATRFELDELQAKFDAEVQTSSILRENLRHACQLCRSGLGGIREALRTHCAEVDDEVDWMRFEVQKRFSAIIIGEEDRIEAARESAQLLEQSTRRSFARAFEARIAELEEELAARDGRIKSMDAKLGAARQASAAAEALLKRIRDRT